MEQLLVSGSNHYSFRMRTTTRSHTDEYWSEIKRLLVITPTYIGRWVNLYWSSHEAI